MHIVTPHTAGAVAHKYVVTTLTDAKLLGSAPAHTCEDVGAPTKCSLRAAISVANSDFTSAANQWDVITVPKGTIDLASGNETLSIANRGALSIEGAGPGQTIINGATDHFNSQILNLEAAGASLSVTGVTFDGGDSSFVGGAIYGTDSGAITVSDCSFLDNSASNDGGAIDVGGAVALTVTDSAFSHNSAAQQGGAVSDTASAPLTVSNDSFSDNSVGPTPPTDDGGAVFAETGVTVDHSTFVGNSAGGYGGAVYAGAGVIATSDSFTHNDSSGDDGGAMYSLHNAVSSLSLFEGNGAVDGGALYVGAIGNIASDSFVSNRASGDGSDVYDNGQVTATNSTFTKGNADVDGGSIFVNDSALTVSGGSITDAVAHDSATYFGGGAIYGTNATVSLSDVTLKGNQASGSGGSGGAIGLNDSLLDITGGALANNRAGDYGGAVSLYASPSAVINGATIVGNVSQSGGGVYATEATLDMNADTVDGNSATAYWGGGLALDNGTDAVIANSTIAVNKAKGTEGYGGGLAAYNNGSAVTVGLSNDTIANNAAIYGGGMYAYVSTASLSSSTVAFNTTGTSLDHGGGVYANNSTVASTDTIWSSNSGRQCAGTGYTGALVGSDGGNNLDSDDTCGFRSPHDVVSKGGFLGALADNGGPTPTILPFGNSPAIGTGAPACPAYDQRGVHATGAPCSMGAVFAVATKATLRPNHAAVVAGHEQGETFTVTVTSTLDGTPPTGEIVVMGGTKLACHATLHRVGGPTSRVAVATCSLGANTLPADATTHLTAIYKGAGALSEAQATGVLNVKSS